MFSLTPEDMRGRILGCADGPASFNAEATAGGVRVVSCDPLYKLAGYEIQNRIEATYPEMIAQTRQNHSAFVWTEFEFAEELGRARMDAMRLFLDDYDVGRQAGRYVGAELPLLPFADQSFDLALCSHYLFLYSEQLCEEFHVASVRELLRVAAEVRVFPLLSLNGARSRHVIPVAEGLEDSGHRVSLERVRYEFQRGGNQMMRVNRASR